MWFSEAEYPDEGERTLNNGRWAQNHFQYLPGSSVDPLDLVLAQPGYVV